MSEEAIARVACRQPWPRRLGSALYFLVTPEAPVRLLRIRNDQVYHYYLGDPLEVFLLRPDGATEHIVAGPDIRAGQRVQLFHSRQYIPYRTPSRFSSMVSGRAPNGLVSCRRMTKLGTLRSLQIIPDLAPEMRAIAASVKVVTKPGAALR